MKIYKKLLNTHIYRITEAFCWDSSVIVNIIVYTRMDNEVPKFKDSEEIFS